tara:strand:- start:176 stop:1312 length:1137 start_codon:yes stop_codon:yes gene_type:complete
MIKNRLNKNTLFLSLIITYIPLFKYFIFLNNNKGHSFMTADWLINYKYGFINRGLIGNLFWSITDDPNLLLDIISFFLILIYIFIFYFLNKIFISKKQNFLSIVLIFSPAAFLFPIYDSQGAFRKEILGILALFILASNIKSKNNYWFLLSSFVYTIGIFSHTVNFFFLSTILYLIYFVKKSKKIFDYSLFIIPSVTYIFFHFSFSNTEALLFSMRNKMCEDLREIGLFNLCGHGSFDYLTWDLNAAFLITQNIIINERRQEYYFYIFLFLISFIPYLFDKNFKNNLLFYIFIGTSFAPLFLLAYDWGRWIFIMHICFLVNYLLSDKQSTNNKYFFILVLFPILFRIEHCCDPIFQFNREYVLSNLSYLIQNIYNIFY